MLLLPLSLLLCSLLLPNCEGSHSVRLLRSHPCYNLRYCAWVPSMSAGLSYVIRTAMKNWHNLLHSILHTFRLEMTRRDLISRCWQWTPDWTDCRKNGDLSMCKQKQLYLVILCTPPATGRRTTSFLPIHNNILYFIKTHLTRVGNILKKSHEGHLGVVFDPQKEIVITYEILRIFQPNFTGISHIWSGIWKYVNFFFPRWRPTWPPKFWIECISAVLSDTKTNKVSIHIKWKS